MSLISLVTVNWNGAAFLPGFLDSLAAQSDGDFRLHLVDNGSRDASLSIVERYRERLDIDLIRLGENSGFARANNIGIRAAMRDASRWVVTLNNDLELKEDCLERLRAAMEREAGAGFFQILMVNFYERGLIDAAGMRFSRNWEAHQVAFRAPLAGLSEIAADIEGACAGAAAFTKEALAAVEEESGYFDSRFFAYSEDTDLALRLRALGIRGRLAKDAVVYHVHSGTCGIGSPFKEYYLTRNRYLYLYKDLPAPEYRRVWPGYLALDLKNWARYALRGEWRRALAGMRGALDFVRARRGFRR